MRSAATRWIVSRRGLTHLALLASPWIAASPRVPAPHTAPAHRTRVVILGSGTPNADPDHSGPAVAIVVDSTAYLVDAGAGVVRRAALAASTDSIPALNPSRLGRVFVTHLHSDHTLGMPDLILTPWILGRTAPLDVYGPPGTARMLDLLEQAYSADIEIRLHGGEPSNKTGYAATAHDVSPGVVYRDKNVTVTAFEVTHGKWEHAYGYVFKTADRTIVISGDTRSADAVARACDQCDVLVHEVYSPERLKLRTPDWQAYHRAYHTSTYELGELANRSRPKLLVLYHQLGWGDDDAELVRQVRTRYAGTVVSGRDLGVY
jgi:ribonuclease BN (tRNA processing enzyme)